MTCILFAFSKLFCGQNMVHLIGWNVLEMSIRSREKTVLLKPTVLAEVLPTGSASF